MTVGEAQLRFIEHAGNYTLTYRGIEVLIRPYRAIWYQFRFNIDGAEVKSIENHFGVEETVRAAIAWIDNYFV